MSRSSEIAPTPTRVCQTRCAVGGSTSRSRGGRPEGLRAALPGLGVAGDGRQPGPHVLAALGVVGRERGHPQRPVQLLVHGPLVHQLDRRDVEQVRVASDLVEPDLAVPAVERGVLDALGHHRPPGLLEADREVAGRLVVPGAGGQLDELLDLGLQVGAGRARDVAGVLEAPPGDVVGLGAGLDVGAIDLAGDEQLDDRLLETGRVRVGQGLPSAADQPAGARGPARRRRPGAWTSRRRARGTGHLPCPPSCAAAQAPRPGRPARSRRPWRRRSRWCRRRPSPGGSRHPRGSSPPRSRCPGAVRRAAGRRTPRGRRARRGGRCGSPRRCRDG